MKQTIITFLGLLIVSCNSNSNSSEKANQTVKTLNQLTETTFLLPDSLFAFCDVKNSLFVNDFWYDRDNNFELYSDVIRKIRFIKLDTVQQRKLVAPVITSEMDIGSEYVTHWMEGRFISKQKKIGDFTPIVVWVNGDDYCGLFYILLDKNYNPVSHFRLNGGFCAGPNYPNDTIVELCSVRHSFIEGQRIKTYSVTEFIRVSDSEELSTIDSINFISNILTTGKIQTKQVDSTRYERATENSNAFRIRNE